MNELQPSIQHALPADRCAHSQRLKRRPLAALILIEHLGSKNLPFGPRVRGTTKPLNLPTVVTKSQVYTVIPPRRTWQAVWWAHKCSSFMIAISINRTADRISSLVSS